MNHPITPPPELVYEWANSCPFEISETDYGYEQAIAEAAAQWGADQELEACFEWLEQNVGRWEIPLELRTARRPEPPSLREQALADLDEIGSHYIGPGTAERITNIRRALESLDD